MGGAIWGFVGPAVAIIGVSLFFVHVRKEKRKKNFKCLTDIIRKPLKRNDFQIYQYTRQISLLVLLDELID